MKTIGWWLLQIVSILGSSYFLYTEMVADGVPPDSARPLAFIIGIVATYSIVFMFFGARDLLDRKRAGLPIFDWPAIKRYAARRLQWASAAAFALMLLWGFIHASGPERWTLVTLVFVLIGLLASAYRHHEPKLIPDAKRPEIPG